jgi:conjugal transfer pilus assembly protein TraB
VLRVGAYAGVSTAMDKLADFYLDCAEEIYPVIEFDAMRQATAHLTRGVHLRVMTDARHGEQLAQGSRR